MDIDAIEREQERLSQTPCAIIADLLASKLYHDFEHYHRDTLYVWEMRACRYLLAQLDAGTYYGSDWTAGFIRTNRHAITADTPKMDFNLKASRLANYGEATNPAP